MEKIETKIKRAKEKIHKFFCDKCGKHIATYGELEDGYYCEPEHIELKIFLFDKWFYLDKGIFCGKCEEKIKKELINNFENIGFKGED